MSFEPRFYRDFTCNERWETYRVQVESTDLYVRTQGNQSFWVQKKVCELRSVLTEHFKRQPRFLDSLIPVPRVRGVHPMLKAMYQASEAAGTGPMAAVAGAIAQWVGHELGRWSKEVIVENGGDLYLILEQSGTLTLYAGDSKFSGTIGLALDPGKTPLAVCTSSGTVGHSYSQGKADAAVIMAQDACLADAVATGAANRIATKDDLEKTLDYALKIPGVLGAVLVLGDNLAAKGDVELVAL
ncbi:MAG: UPF0280 family protein [Desulfovermiculus sp.]|nr:UPF0280 family protein [Desulfovermiculus sp.]